MDESSSIARRDPADALRVGCAARLKRELDQLIFELAGVFPQVLGEAVNLEILKPHVSDSKKMGIIGVEPGVCEPF